MINKLYDLDNGIAKIIVPMPVHKNHLKENYNDIVEELFTEITGTNFKFEYLLEEEIEKNITIDAESIGVPSFNSFESNFPSLPYK